MEATLAHHRKPCVFSLDRIESIEITDRHFKLPDDFSPMEFFADAFGVMVPDNMEPELVKLRAYGDEMFYLASRVGTLYCRIFNLQVPNPNGLNHCVTAK